MSGVCLNPISIETAGNVVDRKKSDVNFDIIRSIKRIENFGEEELRVAAKSYDWKLIGKVETCENFAVGKSKQVATR
jgi:hypothetical protein